jgi:hypothetical protein
MKPNSSYPNDVWWSEGVAIKTEKPVKKHNNTFIFSYNDQNNTAHGCAFTFRFNAAEDMQEPNRRSQHLVYQIYI